MSIEQFYSNDIALFACVFVCMCVDAYVCEYT